MQKQILFSHQEDFRKSHPHYEDFAILSRRIISFLNDLTNENWQSIDIGESTLQLDANLLEMMEKDLLDYEVLCSIFETKSQGKVASKSQLSFENKLEVVETFENNLIFFPQYNVALTLAFNYSAGNTWPEYHFFSTSVENALNFLQEINEKLRQLLMQSVTYLVDTESGVQRRNYGEQAVVSREDVLLAESIKQDIFRSIDEFF